MGVQELYPVRACLDVLVNFWTSWYCYVDLISVSCFIFHMLEIFDWHLFFLIKSTRVKESGKII